METQMDRILSIRQRAFWRNKLTLTKEEITMLTGLAMDHLERTEQLPKRLDMTVMWIIVGAFFGFGLCASFNVEKHVQAETSLYGEGPGQTYISPLDRPSPYSWDTPAPAPAVPYGGAHGQPC